jgi:16S rRNA (cytidine1402-2'-O)-methyltransferase
LNGTLYLVSTPIGNLEDITLRALRILRDEAAVVACEDTRQTRKLLEHFEIRKPLVSYHDHNETTRTPDLAARLMAGESVALVSDAGTPLVSDPGYRLVEAAIERGIRVVPVPGVSAVLAALSASGLPTGEFRFSGFLPNKSGLRRRFLEEIKNERATLVVYDSPHRILDSLEEIDSALGERQIVVARELTKLHEEFLRGTAREILDDLRARPSIKGEITLVIAPAEENKATGNPITEVVKLEAAGLDRMDAIKTVARQFGIGKRELYRKIVTDFKP